MKLAETIVGWKSEIAAIRRDIHAHPELAYEEVRTADLVASKLESWGITVHRGLGVTGVVGVIEGNTQNGYALGLRADMDALPMQEANTFEHASKFPGKMHACGHDGHTAMLLAAARHLAQHRDFGGTVYVIFQPAEEGFSGAKAMIDDGLFTRFPMQAVFGMHNWPGMPVGTFALRPGAMMASSNTFEIRIEGKGAHGGMPNLGNDPVMAAVQLAQALQTIISRELDPLDNAVLSITQIHSGSADNVIPNEAFLRGTVRTFSEAVLDLIETRMRDIATLSCQAMKCSVDFAFHRKYPPTLNEEGATAFCAQVIESIVGKEHVRQSIRPSMGAEDFAFMLLEKPGCYVWIGNGDGDHREGGHGLGPCMLHNGSYDFNDDLIPLGATYWVELARQWLAAQPA
ncbi:M20 aminoacylase family protein [Pusillimonas sp. ANT_WB101]|uniref:M20 aminoacylase family protein n=1 Tax=Pusillimonas sp. ANT_WB101 TaxID=2597356 RepID=UPI0011EF6FE9|nr:M20 aminoacylase family protein [Pusillimonas sp. ANT_WB101]KAA0890283.1 amidohydrolase [Pusillimonas sp. ANT_WB101]